MTTFWERLTAKAGEVLFSQLPSTATSGFLLSTTSAGGVHFDPYVAPTPPPPPPAGNPSGEAPITTAGNALFSNTPILSEDFKSSGLPGTFWPYNGKSGDTEEGGTLHVQWNPSHVECLGDDLARLISKWDTTGTQPMIINAGIGTNAAWTYGATFFRAKRTFNIPIDHFIALLFPKVGWPPEIDFDEDGGTNYNFSATLHYGSSNSQIQKTNLTVDATQWHTYGCLWSPGSIVLTVDGDVWGTITSSDVPDVPMWAGFQTEYEGPVLTAASALTDEVDIDWIVVFPYSG